MMHRDSLEPAAIRFTLERLQESARRSGYFLPAFFMYLYPQEPYCACIPKGCLDKTLFTIPSSVDNPSFLKFYTSHLHI